VTIGNKIIIAFGVPVAFTIVVGGISIALMRGMNETIQQIALGSLPGTDAVGRLAGIAKDVRGGIRFHQAMGAKVRAAVVLLDAGDDDSVAAPSTSQRRSADFGLPPSE